MIEQIQQLTNGLLDLVFPYRCVACGYTGGILCESCKLEFESYHTVPCEQCGLTHADPRYCAHVGDEPTPLHSVRSAFLFDGALRNAVHALKYQGQKAVSKPLAELMATQLFPDLDVHLEIYRQLAANEPFPDILLCPVPLSAERLSQRGYNQAELLAESLCDLWGIECLPLAGLARIRNTESQVEKNFQERQENLKGAFEANPDLVRDRVIILVDDVCTTGSTLVECAKALGEGGVLQVLAITLAHA